jgi:hypothetical protein
MYLVVTRHEVLPVMTSIHDEIQALFSWNPPALKPVTLTGKKTSTKSTSSPPAFYDKHLVGPLALRCVKRLPSLVQDLAANVDRALQAASETLPPVDGFYTAKDTERAVRNTNKNIKDEQGVANFYSKTTGMFCTPLASTLALHPKASASNWRTLLEWTQSVSSSGYAIMDGELGILAAASDDEDAAHEMILVETMESETRRIFNEIRDSLDPFATWEIKSPFAGPLEVMLAVPNLGNFSWMSCTYPECLTDKKHINELKKTESIKMGVDALAPPWNVNVSLFPPKTMGWCRLCYRTPCQTLMWSLYLQLSSRDLLDRRGNQSNNTFHQLQRQPPLLQWRRHRN